MSPLKTSARKLALPPTGMRLSAGLSLVSFTRSAEHTILRLSLALSPSASVTLTVAWQELQVRVFTTLAAAALASCAQPPQVNCAPAPPPVTSAVRSTMSPNSAGFFEALIFTASGVLCLRFSCLLICAARSGSNVSLP